MQRKVISFFTALVIASALWVAVNLANEIAVTVRIPFVVELPEGRASISPMPRQVRVTARGPGWRVVQFALFGNPACTVDVSDVAKRGAATSITHRMIVQSINAPSQIAISDVEPDSVRLMLEAFAERTVPIEPALHVDCVFGFEQTGAVRVEPDSVRIRGAASIVAGIGAIATRPMSIVRATAAIHADAPLADSLNDLVTMSQQSAVVHADVQQIAERIFTHVPVRVANPHVHLVPATITVVVRGGVEALAAMTENDIPASVESSALMESGPGARVAVAAPPFTTVLRYAPRRVDWYLRNGE